MAYLAGTSVRTLEAANLFCGATGQSNHLRLANVKLPDVEEVYVDHRPGGAPVAIEVDVMIQRLECDFTLVGWNPEIDALLNAWQDGQNQFWFFGAIRDRVIIPDGGTTNVFQAIAKMTGRLGKSQPGQWQRGALGEFSYSIRGIIAYRLTVAGSIVYDWDFFNNSFSTSGDSPGGTPV